MPSWTPNKLGDRAGHGRTGSRHDDAKLIIDSHAGENESHCGRRNREPLKRALKEVAPLAIGLFSDKLVLTWRSHVRRTFEDDDTNTPVSTAADVLAARPAGGKRPIATRAYRSAGIQAATHRMDHATQESESVREYHAF